MRKTHLTVMPYRTFTGHDEIISPFFKAGCMPGSADEAERMPAHSYEKVYISPLYPLTNRQLF